jgi:hypothetical protein
MANMLEKNAQKPLPKRFFKHFSEKITAKFAYIKINA